MAFATTSGLPPIARPESRLSHIGISVEVPALPCHTSRESWGGDSWRSWMPLRAQHSAQCVCQRVRRLAIVAELTNRGTTDSPS